MVQLKNINLKSRRQNERYRPIVTLTLQNKTKMNGKLNVLKYKELEFEFSRLTMQVWYFHNLQ